MWRRSAYRFGREQRGCQATEVSMEIVRGRDQSMGAGSTRNLCVNGTTRVRDVPLLQSDDVEKAMTWKPGTSGPSARKIMFLDTPRAHCRADATNEMAVDSPPEEQVKGKDSVGKLLKSLYGARKTAHNWEKKWQHVLIEMNFEIWFMVVSNRVLL